MPAGTQDWTVNNCTNNANGHNIQRLDCTKTQLQQNLCRIIIPTHTWTSPGNPGAAAAPSTLNGAIYDNTTAGRPFPYTTESGGDSSYLARAAAWSSIPGCYLIADRLWANGGLSGTTTTTQTITQPALTRYTNGQWVSLWLDFYAPTGNATGTFTIVYKNQANVTQTTAFTLITTNVCNFTSGVGSYFVPLVSGDYGVRSVTSITLSASSGTAGNYGLTLRKILYIDAIIGSNSSPQVGGGITIADIYRTCFTPIASGGACLELLTAQANNTGNADTRATISILQGQ